MSIIIITLSNTMTLIRHPNSNVLNDWSYITLFMTAQIYIRPLINFNFDDSCSIALVTLTSKLKLRNKSSFPFMCCTKVQVDANPTHAAVYGRQHDLLKETNSIAPSHAYCFGLCFTVISVLLLYKTIGLTRNGKRNV